MADPITTNPTTANPTTANPATGPDLGGVVVAAALPYRPDDAAPAGLAVDEERFAEHCRWLIDNGCHGIGVNGSLGEYSSLTDAERRRAVQIAVEAVAGRGIVIAGVHAVGWHQARHWAELAAADGADAALLLPPIVYRANRPELIEHYRRVAEVGLPVMAYNNPADTKVDLTPDLLAELAEIPNVVAVKEFSTDVRRVIKIQQRCGLQVIAGADDLVVECLLAGATGWFAGYPNAFPAASVELYDLARAHRIEEALELYHHLVPAFRWDTTTEFVQAIKASMDLVGRYGGRCRPPRGPLLPDQEAAVRRQTQDAIDYLAGRAG